jgi:quercetin dioxygenase-like cupin family protein
MQAQPPAVVSIEQEPRHRPVFRAGAVRILDVQIPPGDVTLYHIHDTAILYVPISISATDTQILGKEWLGLGPNDRSRFTGLVVASDTSYAQTPLTHRVKNVGQSLFRLIAITNAATPEAAATQSPPGKPVLTSPWYSATQLTIVPQASSEWATPNAPTVIVLPGTGRVRVEGTREDTPMAAPGSWVYIETGQRYRITNLSAGVVTVVLVQTNL